MSTNGNTNGTHTRIDAPEHVVPLLINGKEVVNSDNTFDVVSPVTNKLIWKASAVSKKQAIEAVEASQAAFPAWSKTKPSFRRDILIKASDILRSRGDEICRYMDLETGSTPAKSTNFNLPFSIELLRDVGGRIVTVTGNIPISRDDGRSALMYREPYGVILGIAPWNAPLVLGFRAISYALAAGNTCILKGSEMCPRCFWCIGSIFMAAGLPKGVLNVIFHRPQDAPEVTSALIEHPFVKKINFTGSSATGSIIATQAGKFLKPVLMELGGKASAIVLKDANIPLTAEKCVAGSFSSSGQVCMSTERILVHSSIAEEFRQALKAAVGKIYYGKESAAPILINASPVQKNKKLVEQALSKGANVLVGDLEESSGTRMRPIIVENVTKEMDIYKTESFGPTVSLIVVDSEAEAIKIANDTEYGLSSAIFTEDLAAGLRVAKQIETGAVHINNSTVHDEPNLPHGGAKQSGWGRFNGSAGIEEFLRSKCVTWSD